jgi:hypothetical protein
MRDESLGFTAPIIFALTSPVALPPACAAAAAAAAAAVPPAVLLFVSSAAWTVTNMRDELGDVLAGDDTIGDLTLAGFGLGKGVSRDSTLVCPVEG